jgi:hypothetical protein
MGNGKANNVIEYLDNLQEKGKASQGAITPLKIAFTKVLQTVDGDKWEDTEVNSIDLDDYMARFSNLTMGKYSTESLTAYKSRVNRVLGWYTNFLDKPGWAPNLQQRTRTPKTEKKSKPAPPALGQTPQPPQSQAPHSMPEVANSPGRVLYPYPLLDGQLIHISLPIRLSKTDAQRIAAFVESIAVEETNTVSRDD